MEKEDIENILNGYLDSSHSGWVQIESFCETDKGFFIEAFKKNVDGFSVEIPEELSEGLNISFLDLIEFLANEVDELIEKIENAHVMF